MPSVWPGIPLGAGTRFLLTTPESHLGFFDDCPAGLGSNTLPCVQLGQGVGGECLGMLTLHAQSHPQEEALPF